MPKQVNFALGDIGTISAPVRISITNTGERAGPFAVYAEGDKEFQIEDDKCTDQVLDKQADCSVNVRFAPDTPGPFFAFLHVEGPRPATLITERNTVTLTGEANPVAIEPPSADFGSVTVDSTSPETTFVLTASAKADSGVPQIELSAGSTPLEFRLSNDACTGPILAPGRQCTVGVVFAPTVAGPADADVYVRLNESHSIAHVTGSGL
jgi:hypothetical protein